MLVEYEVIQVVTMSKDAVLDVPISKIKGDGTIDRAWARENVGELESTDTDVLEERLGGGETAYGTPIEEDV